MTTTSLHRPESTGTDSPRTAAVLALTGDVGISTADTLRRYLDGVIERGCDVVVDCTQVQVIDCACVEVLVEAARAAAPLRLTVALAGPSPLVCAALGVTGADTDLPAYPDRDTALLARDSRLPAG